MTQTVESLFVACTPGLESVLCEELISLGIPAKQVPGGAEANAPTRSYEKVNRWSRVASRVLLRVGSASHPADLANVSLGALRASGRAIRVDASGANTGPWLKMAERAWGASAEKDVDALEVALRVTGGRCIVSVDTTGELLHFRGYRQEVGRAPLRETLAAGVLRLAKYTGVEPLWDVMCGSGTLVIEAAELSLGLEPGRNRSFAFEKFEGGGAAVAPVVPRALQSPIFASDLNAGALGVCRRNAKRAGVLECLTMERLDATKLAPRPTIARGLVVANLPYGKRVAAKSELAVLYAQLGASLRRACPGWRFAFLLEDGAEWIGFHLQQTYDVSNGGLRCHVVTGVVPGV